MSRGLVAGVDLAVTGRTGVVILDTATYRVKWAGLVPGGARSAATALQGAAESRLVLVAVDAPLGRAGRGLRCEERLLARCTGVGLLPAGLPGMRRLHREALELARALPQGAAVVETYPAAAARILGLERPRGPGRHVADAALAAVAAAAVLRGEALGACCGPGCIYVPGPGLGGVARRVVGAALEML